MLAEGRSIGQKIGAGTARVVRTLEDMNRVQPGDVLVADMTDPDWEPIMKRAAAIVTNRGGRTCHAAIIARELGVPAVVGTGNALDAIPDGAEVTVSCAEGDTGFIYDGKLAFERITTDLGAHAAGAAQDHDERRQPRARVRLRAAAEPGHRPGAPGIHHRQPDRRASEGAARIRPSRTPRPGARSTQLIAGYADPVSFYVDRLAEGIATLTAAFAPKPVIVRLSDFKSNEYANLIGGKRYEPHEENPMIGFRGATRYVDPSFEDCFALECRAMRKVREEMGLTNCWVMIPFVRTLDEGRQVIEVLAKNGLVQGENGLKIIMMCEVPSNALLADEFLDIFDGFSIGSNDLTQLTLGLDRDSGIVATCSTSATRRSRSCCRWRSRPPSGAANTSASAARAPATTPTSPNG